MDFVNALRVAMKGLAVHKVRALLSMLGIIFGVASVVAVIAVSEGAKGEVLKQLAALGANNIIVRGLDWRATGAEAREKKKLARLRSDGLTLREAQAAAETCPLFSAYAPVRKIVATVRHGETPLGAEVVGTTPAFLAVMGFSLRAGRWLNDADEAAARRVCVVEEAIWNDAFTLPAAAQSENGPGKILVLDHEPYLVIGVLKGKAVTDAKYSVKEVDVNLLNRRVYIPLSAALARSTREPLSDELSEVLFQCRSPDQIYLADVLLKRFYESAHRMENVPPEDRDYKVLIAQELVRQAEKAQDIFNVVMLCSAGISLVVGGIGIMNIMLANVSERRREVGIRRAVGATAGDILKQFLLESLIVCLLGGLLGCLVGVGFTILVETQTGWQTELSGWGMLVAVGVSLLDGVAFGTYPAWQAAQLDPIEALRYE